MYSRAKENHAHSGRHMSRHKSNSGLGMLQMYHKALLHHWEGLASAQECTGLPTSSREQENQ